MSQKDQEVELVTPYYKELDTKELDTVEIKVSGKKLRALLPEIDGVGYGDLASIPEGLPQYYEDKGLSDLLAKIEADPKAEFPLTLQRLTKDVLPNISRSAEEAQLLRDLQSLRPDRYVQVKIKGDQPYSLIVPESEVTRVLFEYGELPPYIQELASIEPAYETCDGGEIDNPSFLSRLYNRFGRKIILLGVLAATLLPFAVACRPRSIPTPEPTLTPTSSPTSTPSPTPTNTPTPRPTHTPTVTPSLRECVSSDLEDAFTPYDIPLGLIEDGINVDVLKNYLNGLGYMLKGDGTVELDDLVLEAIEEGKRIPLCTYEGIKLTKGGELALPIVDNKLWIPHVGGGVLVPIELEIKYLEWTPIKVINDKVCEGEVRFVAKSNGPNISEASVMFIPKQYHGLPKEAFPNEDPRNIILKPIDGEFDEPIEEFTAVIKKILGGREYQIKANVTNETGQKASAIITTPYIREFENIAPLDDITIAAFYYNWYSPNYPIPRNLPNKPLLGLYNSNDNVVFNRHVDWATGHGIDVFVFPWFFQGHEQHRIFERNREAELFDDIEFSFISTFVDRTCRGPPYNFDDPKVKQDFIDNIGYLKSMYLKLPNAWKVDGKPVIVTWSTHAYESSKGNIVDAFKSVGQGKDVYLMGTYAGTGKPNFEWYKSVDAMYDYEPLLNVDRLWPHAGGEWGVYRAEDVLDEALETMRGWKQFVERMGIKYVPTISPGFDNTYDYRAGNNRPSIIVRSPYSFEKFISEVKKGFLDKDPKIIFVTTFNEWFEGTQIAPNKDYGFEYLRILKDKF